MNDELHDYFGEPVAATYDAGVAEMFSPEILEAEVAFLASQANGGEIHEPGMPAGRILELGIGTGRIALPLIERGIDVAGIDLSTAMVQRLKEKPGGADIEVAIGDFATTRVGGEFGLVVLVFNTIMNLTTQDAQVACFRNAAAHLELGGRFVIDVLVPGLHSLPPGETIRPFDVTAEHLGFDEYTDLANQQQSSHHYWIDGDKVRVNVVPFRFVWPSELDLMAQLAGMRLVERYEDWDRSPFTSESTRNISVWEKVV